MDDDRIKIGHVNPFWDQSFKQFNYVKQDVTDLETSRWHIMGYDHVKSFTGWMYDSRNPMPEWLSIIKKYFGLQKQTYTFYKMKTLEIMPQHFDHYSTYIKLNDVTYDDVYRAVIMLEDWKPGHYFELDGKGYVNWKAGDWFLWKGNVVHAASNIGTEDRYTLQITGVKLPQGTIKDLFVGNFLDQKDSEYDLHFNDKIVNELKNSGPFMIYMHNGKIKDLDNIKHEEENIKYLNEKGITIHLFEPLSEHIKDQNFNHDFYSELHFDTDPNEIRTPELDSILNYAEKNNLTNIRVKTGNYEAEKYFPFYINKLKLETDDLFLKVLAPTMNPGNIFNSNFVKRFINLNWRYTKHRQFVSTFLSNKSCFLSWYFKRPFEGLYETKSFNFDQWSKKYPKYFDILKNNTTYINDNVPFVLDYQPLNDYDDSWPLVQTLKKYETPAISNKSNDKITKLYNDSFLDIVTESRFGQHSANISEKILQPIQYFRPFIVVGPPKTLEYLKTFGYKTFGDFWDESYDDILDHGDRLAKIFEVIEFIESLSENEVKDMFKKIVPTLIYNCKTYNNIQNK